MKPGTLALIGSGPSAIYLLKHLLDAVDALKGKFREISIFEKNPLMGFGMPYSPLNTDRYNLSNISSAELSELPLSLVDWLRGLDPAELKALDLEDEPIDEETIYGRLVLGHYLNSQYCLLTAGLADCGIAIHEFPGCEIADVLDDPAGNRVTLTTADGTVRHYDQVIVASGHYWTGEDKPEAGYFASPWPISKLLPPPGGHHNFTIGTLGASLSAFDVIASLAHRHGDFTEEAGELVYQPQPGTDHFKFAMHSSDGKLPHLQFALEEDAREIYRHVDRRGMLSLTGEDGYLRLETYFREVCRPALREAFRKDGLLEMAESMEDPAFELADFVEAMSAQHEYANAFEGMRCERIEARESVLQDKPIHWKEVTDDLIYTLNFHAELMPAEDHLTLKSTVMPFLMNVIAAMPLQSADKLLALYDAGKLEMVSGKAHLADEQEDAETTTVTVEDEDGNESKVTYRLFVDCSGQRPLEPEDYPFQGLVDQGAARKARASFADGSSLTEEQREKVFREAGEPLYPLGGMDIDGTYRLIGADGEPSPRIHDISFPHTSGVRPYSYGLQACSDTGAILVRSWIEEIEAGAPVENDTADIARIYEKV